jgi:hypothetical protein
MVQFTRSNLALPAANRQIALAQQQGDAEERSLLHSIQVQDAVDQRRQRRALDQAARSVIGPEPAALPAEAPGASRAIPGLPALHSVHPQASVVPTEGRASRTMPDQEGLWMRAARGAAAVPGGGAAALGFFEREQAGRAAAAEQQQKHAQFVYSTLSKANENPANVSVARRYADQFGISLPDEVWDEAKTVAFSNQAASIAKELGLKGNQALQFKAKALEYRMSGMRIDQAFQRAEQDAIQAGGGFEAKWLKDDIEGNVFGVSEAGEKLQIPGLRVAPGGAGGKATLQERVVEQLLTSGVAKSVGEAYTMLREMERDPDSDAARLWGHATTIFSQRLPGEDMTMERALREAYAGFQGARGLLKPPIVPTEPGLEGRDRGPMVQPGTGAAAVAPATPAAPRSQSDFPRLPAKAADAKPGAYMTPKGLGYYDGERVHRIYEVHSPEEVKRLPPGAYFWDPAEPQSVFQNVPAARQ